MGQGTSLTRTAFAERTAHYCAENEQEEFQDHGDTLTARAKGASTARPAENRLRKQKRVRRAARAAMSGFRDKNREALLVLATVDQPRSSDGRVVRRPPLPWLNARGRVGCISWHLLDNAPHQSGNTAVSRVQNPGSKTSDMERIAFVDPPPKKRSR